MFVCSLYLATVECNGLLALGKLWYNCYCETLQFICIMRKYFISIQMTFAKVIWVRMKPEIDAINSSTKNKWFHSKNRFVMQFLDAFHLFTRNQWKLKWKLFSISITSKSISNENLRRSVLKGHSNSLFCHFALESRIKRSNF